MTDELVDFEAFHEKLVMKVESMREFRAREASDHPGDARLAQAAEVLRRSFHEVDALPADDTRLRVLALAAQERDAHIRIRFTEQQDHLIGRHGLEGCTRTTDELLSALVTAAEGARS
jgi:hypothetical protein